MKIDQIYDCSKHILKLQLSFAEVIDNNPSKKSQQPKELLSGGSFADDFTLLHVVQ